jgi:hypothetical protein
LANWLHKQLEEVDAEPEQPSRRKKSAKTMAREASRDEAAQGATRAVREIFRKLVSELHPDRETDPQEHARKTELMQRVNQAYKAGDLLALLELQLSIEQIDPKALAGMAEQQLKHYIHVLEEQSRRLREELKEFVAHFAAAMGESPSRKLSPASVQRALDADIRELKELARILDADLQRFQDIPAFKRSLREYRFESSEDPNKNDPPNVRRRRRRRGANRS